MGESRFIGEAIEARFARRPELSKRPPCPDAFVWRGRQYRVVEVLSEWHEYERRGDVAANMRPEHAARARRRGSWGVGRHYFRVRTDAGETFELYYDRAPKDVAHRRGGWFLYREIT